MAHGVKVTKLVVIVDDELEMEFIYNLMLENQIKQGLIQLKFFSDSRHFIEWLKLNSPDLILTDINMPFMDGPKVMELIKESGRNIPTYFVSGHDESDFKKIMLELGVYRFLSKPLDINNLQDLIELDLGILTANL